MPHPPQAASLAEEHTWAWVRDASLSSHSMQDQLWSLRSTGFPRCLGVVRLAIRGGGWEVISTSLGCPGNRSHRQDNFFSKLEGWVVRYSLLSPGRRSQFELLFRRRARHSGLLFHCGRIDRVFEHFSVEASLLLRTNGELGQLPIYLSPKLCCPLECWTKSTYSK